jgi:hypothetical protein
MHTCKANTKTTRPSWNKGNLRCALCKFFLVTNFSTTPIKSERLPNLHIKKGDLKLKSRWGNPLFINCSHVKGLRVVTPLVSQTLCWEFPNVGKNKHAWRIFGVFFKLQNFENLRFTVSKNCVHSGNLS